MQQRLFVQSVNPGLSWESTAAAARVAAAAGSGSGGTPLRRCNQKQHNCCSLGYDISFEPTSLATTYKERRRCKRTCMPSGRPLRMHAYNDCT